MIADMIKRCTCKNEQQDKMYGKGNRVHNLKEKVHGRAQEYRCTVCGSVKT